VSLKTRCNGSDMKLPWQRGRRVSQLSEILAASVAKKREQLEQVVVS